MHSFPVRKEVIPELKTVHAQVLQDVEKRLDKTFQAFFRRVKNGGTPAIPALSPSGAIIPSPTRNPAGKSPIGVPLA